MSPTEGYTQFLTQAPPVVQPMMQPVPIVPMMQPQQPQMMMMNQVPPQQSPVMLAQSYPQQQIPLMQQQMVQPQMVAYPQIIPMSHSIPTGTVMPSQPPIIPSNVSQQVKPSLLEQLSSGSLLDSLNQTQTVPVASGPLPAAPTPTPPQSGHASRSMSFSEKAPSVPESP